MSAFGAYRFEFLILTVLGFFGGILEGVGINALIPLFSLFTGEAAGDDIVSQAIKKFFFFFNIDFTLQFLLVFIVILFILKAIILFIGNYIKIRIVADYEKDLRFDLFQGMLRARWPYLLKQKIGHLEKIIMVEATNASGVLKIASGAILLVWGLIVYLAIAVSISLTITLVTLAFGVFLFLVFKPIVKRVRDVSQRIVLENKNVAHFVNENMLGAKTIKAMFIASPVIVIANGYFEKLKELKIENFIWQGIPGAIPRPIALIFITILFIVMHTQPGFNIASFVAVMYLVQRIFSDMSNLQSDYFRIHESVPYLESALRQKEKAFGNVEKIGGGELFVFKDALSFREVSFSYNARSEVLSGINFQIKKGSSVGLIGASGGGKTTVVDLLLRLFEPTQGEIVLDGVSIAKISMELWRRNIGYVSQDMHLVNDTVANNIKFFNPTITDEAVVVAAKMAHIDTVIENLPKKFETVVGERGLLLSAGQRQRIVIARVLARNPQFLILDEATSALDNESELAIQKAIENFKGKITVLIIAHRLGTVMNCDELFVLHGGRIVERGKPQELLKDKQSYFYKAYNIRT